MKGSLSIACLLLGFLLTGYAGAEHRPGASVPAPDFPDGLSWLNVSRPLTLEDLRGKVVILDFWTYGCVNCIHVMDELGRLQGKYGNKLAIIGVHSPKFDNEQNLSTLRSILVRYGRADPVVNDPDYLLMRRYRVPAWPTLVVIDPAGSYVGRVLGEGHEADLSAAIDMLLEEYRGSIDETPLPLAPEQAVSDSSLLAAPAKIATSRDRVAISDTVRNRILVADHEGILKQILGNGQAGLEDGNLTEARFRSPRGISFGPDGSLYVADTGNHAIRRVDLSTGRVETIAGTGKKGERPRAPGGRNPLAVDLRSPWDLVQSEQWLYIAMAGDHRIWRMDLVEGRIEPFAGSGREGIDDGPLLEATFSQPSGLALWADRLYVADAESSAVREIDLKTKRVRTLIGTGLFDFGDRDGGFDAAQLQHPLGIAARGSSELLVADTYNHKLKLIDLKNRNVRTLFGQTAAATAETAGLLSPNEPGGLALAGNKVLIADTNNRRILAYDLIRQTAEEWALKRP
ncbi:MAG: thioredoxin-like domain-containing protein [Pseudomonadota bacterium]|nr:thioredoxin-like domain-containing protein [Pseudomonadota bacterium]